ncbi:GNAT family N-acetyltransferase [Aurantiacibacter sp. D1-12]|uniref:GNAT family N-acetyltransferase n=1 Tax=Aurantiacibacter sp. D1-12 TaxID=2993658 RepID=UPI00237C8DF2|nr:GNAT family N-acetyltransferase [Aurantiacibacter sp. D1-12]MDE1467190.1 GNAT family N-acetyltransferase [Aurantiacibacter sp. D1-12]
MILRPASLADAAPLAQLGRDSFCAKFAHLYDPADLKAFLDEVYSEEAVAEEIADPLLTHRLAVEEDNGALLGFIKLKDPSGYADYSDAQKPIALQQLYCDPDRTGEGIGAVLTDWALAEARTRGCDAMQLSVYSDNPGAQRFYQRYGFIKIADIFFMVGKHRDDEYLFELRL